MKDAPAVRLPLPAPVIPFTVFAGRRQPAPAPVITEISSHLRALLELKPAQVYGLRAIVERALARARSELKGGTR